MAIPVAITGLGVLSGFGEGVEPFWRGLLAGASGVRLSSDRPAVGAEAASPEARAVGRTPFARRMDRLSRLALGACCLAIADAGLDRAETSGERTALALGSSLGNVSETTTFLDRVLERGFANPLLFPNLVFNAPVSYVTIELGITGPSAMLSAGETSGESAIGWGADAVADGRADLCLAGAVDELAPVYEQILHEGGQLAAAGPRPFAARGGGVVPGEGAGVLVLEPLARARARGARVYARLVPQPGFSVPAPVHGWPRDPRPWAARLAPLLADADLVVAAACGVPARDRVEAAALATALRGRAVPVTAPRAATGEFGAAGALAAAAAALAVASGRVPPTRGVSGPMPHGLDVVRDVARAVRIDVAVVDAVARGGACRPLRLERT